VADQLATPEDLASALQKDLDTASATLALEACTAVVQATTGQRIVRVADDEVIIDLDRHDGSLYLYLPELPVVSVSTASVGALAVTDYSAQLSKGRLWRSMGWRSSTVAYWDAPTQATVTYTHGYLPTDQRIQLARGAVLSLATGLYDNPTGAKSESIDDYSVAYERATALMDAAPSLAGLLRRQYGRRARSVKLLTVGND
jgi:hypothetical protein